VSSSNQDLGALRAHLFETLQAVKAGTLELDKARTINEIGKTLIDSAKVEVDYLKTCGGGESQFLDTTVGDQNLPPGIKSITRHRLAG
jgi:hypothetical protein